MSKLSKSCQNVGQTCFLITLIKCLKGHKSLGSLCNVKSKSTVNEWVSQLVTRSPIDLLWTAKNMVWQIGSGPVMIYKAVEVIWIFSAGRAGGWTGINGTIRGPRGPKNIHTWLSFVNLIFAQPASPSFFTNRANTFRHLMKDLDHSCQELLWLCDFQKLIKITIVLDQISHKIYIRM